MLRNLHLREIVKDIVLGFLILQFDNVALLFLKILFIYLFIFRERGRAGERKRNIHVHCLSCAPNWGPFGSQAGT